MMELGDWDLIARARDGDMDCFAELVRRYQRPVIHFCQRMIGSHHDAEEIAQDAFVRVYRHLSRLTPQAKFSTFLFSVARNLALNAARDARKKPKFSEVVTDSPDHTLRPDRAAGLREIESLIEKGLNALSPEHREVLLLREINGMDYESIALVTKSRIGTVKSRIARAREQLRLRMCEGRGDLL